ncbi:MAG TPA: anti-sigma factor [Acidimicrobiales bacterium]|nr:anti-sigma factor [Acidimicrobiales bacterium]
MDRVITCSDAVERLWAFLDRELDARDEEAIEAHLAFCRRCCGELEFARHLRRLLARRTGDELPPEARARLERFVDGLAENTADGGRT